MTPSLLPRRAALRTLAAGAATAGAAVAWPSAAHAGGDHRAADLIIHNGRVRTMAGPGRAVSVVAVRDGRIVATGTGNSLRHLIGPRTQVIDAAGGTVLPGINDSHLHLATYGLGFPPLSVDVAAPTIAELVARVAAATATAPAGTWIRGGGWNETVLGRVPTRHDLDAAAGNRPVVLADFTLHAVVVSSEVLRLAGITRDTQPPAGGVIETDATGEPNGVLREGAQQLVDALVPARTDAEHAQAIRIALATLHAQGITSVTEPGITGDLARLYARLARDGDLPVRLTALLHGGDSPATAAEVLAHRHAGRGVSSRWFALAGVKIFTDGVPLPDAQTSWQSQPYADGTFGGLTIAGGNVDEQVANLREMVRLVHQAGLQIGAHATGDAAIDAVVQAYTRVLGRDRRNRLRHYVIHGDLASPAALGVMARYNIPVNMNAQIHWLIDRFLEANLGAERVDYYWPYRTAITAGVSVASGSDAPVTAPDWRRGVADMVTRVGSLGNVAGADQRISLQQALATYTTAAAWQDRAETWKGTLEPGMAADVCVLAADLDDVDPAAYPGVPVAATILDGTVVYDPSTQAGATARHTGQVHRIGTDTHARCCTPHTALPARHV